MLSVPLTPMRAWDDSSVRHLTDQAFATADARIEHLVEARNVSTVGGLVAAGLGVSALPGLVWNLIGVAGLARRPITGPVVDREFAVITAAGRPLSPSGRLLLDRLEQLEGIGRAARRGDLAPGPASGLVIGSVGFYPKRILIIRLS